MVELTPEGALALARGKSPVRQRILGGVSFFTRDSDGAIFVAQYHGQMFLSGEISRTDTCDDGTLLGGTELEPSITIEGFALEFSVEYFRRRRNRRKTAKTLRRLTGGKAKIIVKTANIA